MTHFLFHREIKPSFGANDEYNRLRLKIRVKFKTSPGKGEDLPCEFNKISKPEETICSHWDSLKRLSTLHTKQI